MDALVMCGGQGSRLDVEPEKPLYPIAGRPMIERVLAALRASHVDAVHAVTSPNAPQTQAALERDEKTVDVIETPGDGYVADLQYALDRIDPPVLTVAADLPLLTGATVDEVLERYEREEAATDGDPASDATVCVPRVLPERLGASVDEDATMDGHGTGEAEAVVATGVNVVGSLEAAYSTTLVLEDPRLAINVNRLADATLAERLLSSDRITDSTAQPLDGGDRS